ncbi:MAG: hypothetical protein ABJB74_22960 [Gemmatimonas sp.]
MGGIPMDSLVVALVVLVAAAFVARKIFAAVRSARNAKAGCATDCGCGSSTPSGTDWSKS